MKPFVVIFFTIIFSLSLLGFIMPDQTISKSERRKLTVSMKQPEKYLADQFPFREPFRAIKAYFSYYGFQKLENNDIVMKKNGLFEIPQYDYSMKPYRAYLNTLKDLSKGQFLVALIPDKNSYLDDETLKGDHDKIVEELNDFSVLDLKDALSLDDYYFGDTHWKQERLEDVSEIILKELGMTIENIQYTQKSRGPFAGVYGDRTLIAPVQDELIYLDQEQFQHINVHYYDQEQYHTLYIDEDHLDPYDFFLGGAQSLIEIENDQAFTDRHLIIFRDSFASSIIPLFTPYFEKITVIDNRYVGSKVFLPLVDFENADVLVLNSDLLVRQSSALRQ